ncbi:glycoside hydrolase family 16 protein [Bipolaris victoriae FI3]|uniref:Glycoside hydrolase family 16 protein n=2 Tax=Bipolaris TaxID=33194 RepID=W6Y0L6_COCC2|nr:glycoside hydrolase family 16 protein [Bipolaris zeicola 26-R-13]XP_014552304.1 glycoside hydrolase family 16 protein [Bipolaris victoriae FI3]EUC31533.1 glycoside hydrolase family 16 protein [Bipolaris zeicola 26-R-13]
MSRFPSLGALLLPLTALLVSPTHATSPYTSSMSETPKDNNADCDCYMVSSGAEAKNPSYFQYYRFYDFRNLPGALDQSPPTINQSQNAAQLPTWQPDLFNSDAWNFDWGIQNWSKDATSDFPVPLTNSPANIYLGSEQDTSYLAMRTTRASSHQTAAEMENQQKNLMHASLRMYGRVQGSSGAVAGFFTFFDDNNESDIEILTQDPKDKIRYTNQPSVDKAGNEIAAASLDPANLPRWDDWHTHRIDWLPKQSYWFLNGDQVAQNTYSVPRKPSYLVLNMWSDGGEWSGNMSVGDSAEFHIQWIDMAFNTSGPYEGEQQQDDKKRNVKRKEKSCKTVCRIDGVKQVGTPEVAYVGSAVVSTVSWSLMVGVVGAVSVFISM